jgi:hypothetical protein
MKPLLSMLVPLFAATLSAQICPQRSLGTNLGVGDDTMFGIQSIGFAFPFAGTTYTDVHICANGYVFLSNGGTPAPAAGDYSPTPAEMASQSPRICVLWCDHNHTAANNAGVYLDANASQCTITWDNAVNYGLTTRFQMQLQLFPSGEIRMFWSEGASNNSTFNYLAGQGITGVSPGLGATQPVPSDLAVQSSSIDNFVYEHWTLQGEFDLPLHSLLLIPTNPGWLWVPTPWTGCAHTHDYGLGCTHTRDSFFEMMRPAAFDLANTRLALQRTANGYVASNASTAAFVNPSGSATIIANADDIVATVTLAQAMPVPGGTTSQLTVSSNGNISLAATGNGAGFAPDAGLFLAWAQSNIAAAWHDYNPAIAGSGKILFEQIGGVAYVTWDNVYSYNTTLPDRFQYQFDLATGNVAIVYQTFAFGAADYLVGYTAGGVSPRTLEIDVSTALATPLAIADVGVQGLTALPSGLPILGNAGFGYAMSFIPAVSPFGILMFGDQPAPGIDLGFLGMTGCAAYVNPNLASVTFVASQPAGTGTQGLPIPNSLPLVGVELYAQAIALTLANPANLVSSNGTHMRIGF